MDRFGSAARRKADMPPGTERIVGARSLAASHRRLHDVLKPGMTVLDVGCGTGAITRGIAEAVGPGGRVVGVDVSPRLIEQAEAAYRGVDGLSFRTGDVYDLGLGEQFDIVTAARVIQWLSDPEAALRSMVKAVVPGGRLLILDYNHEKIEWDPEPPAEARRFYEAFLTWRADAGMDNTIADRLEAMFRELGLRTVKVTPQHEDIRRGDANFEQSAGIWATVCATRGKQMVADGAVTEAERSAAERRFSEWALHSARRHRMYLLAVEGVK